MSIKINIHPPDNNIIHLRKNTKKIQHKHLQTFSEKLAKIKLIREKFIHFPRI